MFFNLNPAVCSSNALCCFYNFLVGWSSGQLKKYKKKNEKGLLYNHGGRGMETVTRWYADWNGNFTLFCYPSPMRDKFIFLQIIYNGN